MQLNCTSIWINEVREKKIGVRIELEEKSDFFSNLWGPHKGNICLSHSKGGSPPSLSPPSLPTCSSLSPSHLSLSSSPFPPWFPPLQAKPRHVCGTYATTRLRATHPSNPFSFSQRIRAGFDRFRCSRLKHLEHRSSSSSRTFRFFPKVAKRGKSILGESFRLPMA